MFIKIYLLFNYMYLISNMSDKSLLMIQNQLQFSLLTCFYYFKSNYQLHCIIYRIMKKIVSTFFILGLAVAADLKLSISNKNINGNPNTHQLSCEGAQGTVQYTALGLPSGVQFNGSAFIITNQASAGNYPIRVKATDASGNSIENVIILTINASLKQIGNFKEQIKDTGSVQGVTLNDQLSKQAIAVENNGQKPALGKINWEQNGRLINGAQFNINKLATEQINNIKNQPTTSTSTNNLERLTNILSTYSTSPSDYVRPNYQNTSRYPQINFPTLAVPTGPNPTTMNIENSQAIRSSSNRNQITADDVTLRAASERHQNSIKGITNLLKLIDQAKANKDKAQADIQTYTQTFNDAVLAQKNVQNQIYANENKVSQIISSINAVAGLVQDLKKQINEIVVQSEALKKQRASMIEAIANKEAQKNSLAQKLKGFDNQASHKIQELSLKSEQCQKIYKKINQKQVEIDNAEKELSRTQEDRSNIIEDIQKKMMLIDDIKKQLVQSENELANAKKRLQDIDQRRLALPIEIYKLKQQVKTLQQKSKGCAQQILKITQRINVLKNQNIQKLSKQINDISLKMNSNSVRIAQIDTQLQKINSQSADFQPKLKQSISDLAFLRAQQIQNENALRIAYQKGNDINNRVALARQNLQAAVKRFQNEYKIVTDATLNLQKARAEEALARLSLEELIAHYSDALPYAIVPNANLGTNPGTPYGNNPSGSPLGQIKTNGNGSPGGFKINSWVNYLSSAYGSGVNPSFIGSVTELFPFNFLSSVNGNNVANGNMRGISQDYGKRYGEKVDCSERDSTGQQVATGSIASITDDGFVLQTRDGKSLKIQVNPCTRLNSNKADYKMKYGDQAIVRGYMSKRDRKAVESVQITFLN